MDQSIIYFVFKKLCASGVKHNSDGSWLVETGIDYYSSIATGVDDVIMTVATILL
jgi:hypothetical protein